MERNQYRNNGLSNQNEMATDRPYDEKTSKANARQESTREDRQPIRKNENDVKKMKRQRLSEFMDLLGWPRKKTAKSTLVWPYLSYG